MGQRYELNRWRSLIAVTELVWDGKYKDGKKRGPVRLALPFQTIETVNESAQDRQRTLELFGTGRETHWRNRLIWGDKKYVLPSLVPEYAGKVNLIYIDPPFDTGADFSFTATIPNHSDAAEDRATTFLKEPSILEQKAYRDTWGRGLDSYLEWFYETVVFLHELLTEGGSLYVHLDWHIGHYAKIVLDEVLGIDSFDSEIIWKSTSAHANNKTYGNIHQTILFYIKGGRPACFNTPLVPYDEDYVAHYYRYKDSDGRRFMSGDLVGHQGVNPVFEWRGIVRPWRFPKHRLDELDAAGKIFWTKNNFPRLKRYLDEAKGMPAQSVWIDKETQYIVSWSTEGVGYPTQKPVGLLKRLIAASSRVGDLVLDAFCGSGTTLIAAETLNRRWIGCDLSRFAIHTTRKQLLSIPGVKPFVVQNLGKYERQAWQVAEFPANGKSRTEEQRQREAAYRAFILDLYRATPVSGTVWLHGAKSGRMVHVGVVDAPVTLADVKAIAREAWKTIGSSKGASVKAGADILGWEFAFELNELAKQVAAESRIEVAFKKIPREVLDKKAVEQGDVTFFELGALSVQVKQKNRDVTLMLTDFTIPTDDIPEEARGAIKHWSQLIDYWAVDWDFKNDTFHNQWQTYRTRRDPKIEMEFKYAYSGSGNYAVVVKVIDILGNDTTKTIEVVIK
jgi:adenine-specific DNA-methyltransferase